MLFGDLLLESLFIILPLAVTVFAIVMARKEWLWLRIVGTVAVSVPVAVASLCCFLSSVMNMMYAPVFIGLLVAVHVLAVVAVFAIWHKLKLKQIMICGSIFAVSLVFGGCYFGYRQHIESIERVKEVSQWEVKSRFTPYLEDNDLVTLDGDQTIDWNTDEPLPNIDGATALYPVYAAIAKETYPAEYFVPREDIIVGDPVAYGEDRLGYLKESGYTAETESEKVTLTTTPSAYENLIDGYADIIFVSSASDEQQAHAAERGVELVFTPIGREAFVFFVNKENPVESLDVQQIIDIYSGKTTRWSDVGVRGFGKIKAYQRPKNSGSQTALEKLMGDTPLMKAPTEYVATGMRDIIQETAYTNFKNAIGYSFRFYATELAPSDGIRLLKINGVEPTKENIENLTYPLASDFFAVTRADASENTKKLLEFVTSEEGQTIVEMAGYSRAGESAW